MKTLRPAAVRALQRLGLNRTAHRIYYRYVHGFEPGQREVVGALRKAFASLRAGTNGSGPAGDYLEFGIFKGSTFWHAQRLAGEYGFDRMRFFGFDSFCGLPQVTGIDQTENDEFYEGQYACSRESVAEKLSERGVDWRRTFLVPGYFRDTLKPALRLKHRLRRAAIVLIDCDLYSSTVEVLRFIKPMIGKGSLVLFDDWNCFGRNPNRGQRRALREFLEAGNGRLKAEPLFSYGSYGQVFKIQSES